jgi:hypothetical protein
MSRRSTSLLPALAGALAILVAACSGATASPIADPTEILVKSVEATQGATSVHVKVELGGEVPFDLGGLMPGASASPSGGGSLDISGSTIEGDLDLAKGGAHLTFALPSLMNLTGDIIAVDDAAYVKVGLLGDKYLKFDQSTAGDLMPSTAPSSPEASPTDPLDELRAGLAALDPAPTKLPDEQCGDATCYRVQVKVDSSEAVGLESLAPGMSGSGTVDVWVRQNDLRPAQISVTANGSEGTTAASLTATVTFSDWDKGVTIQAPPADQVTDGSSFLPGLLPGGLPSLPPDLFPSPSA